MSVTVRVGFTTRRPVVPDERFTYVILVFDDEKDDDPTLTAAQWVASCPRVVMPTSTELVDVVEI